MLGGDRAIAYGGPARVRLGVDDAARLSTSCRAPLGAEESAVVERHVGDWWREAHALRTAVRGKHALARRALTSVLDRPDLGRTEVARRVGGCPSEVSRHFHSNVGMTLTAFRARQRLIRFVGGVDEGATLLAAALDAGFGSYSQCHRVFRSTFGCAPRDFFRAPVRRSMGDAFLPWVTGESGRPPLDASSDDPTRA